MRTAWLAAVLGAVLAACGASADEVNVLRKDMVRLRAEARDARKEAARAREEVAALDLKAEIHAFLQNDKALLSDGRFGALRKRILGDSRSYTFMLSSSETARSPWPLWAKIGERIRVDFVAGSGSPGEMGNRLEVSTRNESFTPLSAKPNQYNAYVLEEGQALELRTTVPSRASSAGKKRKRRGRGGGLVRNVSELLLRYMPSGGADPRRVAYVRVSFLGEAEGDADDDDDDDDDDEEEGGGEEGEEGEDEEGGPSFDFSVED